MTTTETAEAVRGQWQSGKDKPVIEQRHKDAAAWAMDRGGDNLTWDNATASHVSPDRLWQMNRVAEAMARMERDVLASLTPPAQGGEWNAAIEQAAKVAECSFDDRPNSRAGHYSEMDWTDGYREGTRAAAVAVRSLSAIPDASPGSASAPTAERLREPIPYTHAIGEAGQAYIKSVSANGDAVLGGNFYYANLWDAMQRAALSDVGEERA